MTTDRDAGHDEQARAQVLALLVRADDVLKAASNRPDPALGRQQAHGLVEQAASRAEQVADDDLRDELLVQVGRRLDDLRLAEHEQAVAAQRPAGSARSIPLPQPGPGTLDPPPRHGDERVAPGQRVVKGLPVLHVGRVPADTGTDGFRLKVHGRVVGRRHELSWDDLQALPHTTLTTDVHCVTAWSRLDVTWTGVRVRDVLAAVGGPAHGATHALVNGANAYSANLDLPTLLRDEVLLAWACDGQPLTPEHGAPLRLVVPTRYFWKSTKWVESLQLLDRDVPGYWEARGYHNVADPFLEQRYA